MHARPTFCYVPRVWLILIIFEGEERKRCDFYTGHFPKHGFCGVVSGGLSSAPPFRLRSARFAGIAFEELREALATR